MGWLTSSVSSSHAELLGPARVQGVFGVDEGGDAARPAGPGPPRAGRGSSCRSIRARKSRRSGRAESPARPGRCRARGCRSRCPRSWRSLLGAQRHDRPFAELLFDLGDGVLQRRVRVQGRLAGGGLIRLVSVLASRCDFLAIGWFILIFAAVTMGTVLSLDGDGVRLGTIHPFTSSGKGPFALFPPPPRRPSRGLLAAGRPAPLQGPAETNLSNSATRLPRGAETRRSVYFFLGEMTAYSGPESRSSSESVTPTAQAWAPLQRMRVVAVAGVKLCDRFLHDADLLREPVKLVHHPVNLPVRGLDLPLKSPLLMGGAHTPESRAIGDHTLCERGKGLVARNVARVGKVVQLGCLHLRDHTPVTLVRNPIEKKENPRLHYRHQRKRIIFRSSPEDVHSVGDVDRAVRVIDQLDCLACREANKLRRFKYARVPRSMQCPPGMLPLLHLSTRIGGRGSAKDDRAPSGTP